MKRIALVSPFFPYIGGVSVSTERLYEKLTNENYHVDRIDIRFLNKNLNSFRILKLLRFLCLPLILMFRKRYDVIHFHISGSLLRLYITLFRSFFSKKTKFISTVHGDVSNLLNEKFGKFCIKGFDTIICVQKGDKEILSKYYKKDIYEIPAFIPPLVKENYEELIPEKILKFINKDNHKLIVTTGSIVCNNNYFDLYGLKKTIEVFKELKLQNIKCKLLILLLGEEKNKVEKELFKIIHNIANENVIKNNIFIYRVCNTELWPILKKTNIFFRPTLTDGDALSVREALVLNVPVLASNIAKRPQGTTLFDINNKNDFKIKLKNILFKEKQDIEKLQKNNANDIISIY